MTLDRDETRFWATRSRASLSAAVSWAAEVLLSRPMVARPAHSNGLLLALLRRCCARLASSWRRYLRNVLHARV